MRYGLLFLFLSLVGCSSPLDGAARALDALAIVARTGEPVLEAQYAADQKACLDNAAVAVAEACVAKVRATWKPAKDAYRIFRTAWLGADAALRTAEALAAIGKQVDLVTISTKVAEAISAADRFRSAMEQIGHPTPAVSPLSLTTSLPELRERLDDLEKLAAGGAAHGDL